jgi:hypothetical protein
MTDTSFVEVDVVGAEAAETVDPSFGLVQAATTMVSTPTMTKRRSRAISRWRLRWRFLVISFTWTPEHVSDAEMPSILFIAWIPPGPGRLVPR